MKWLAPLGFLGLLGLLVLLLIYLIKPNFQKKAVSSTYVWKLSLKLKKRKNPVNRLQDVLLLICQIVAILSFTLVMAQPVLHDFSDENTVRKIAVIDASAAMRAEYEGETRFERAVNEVRALAEDAVNKEGEITVILAGEKAEFVAVRTNKKTIDELNASLDELSGADGISFPEDSCSFGAADIDGAMSLAEQVLEQTPHAQVLFYTSKTYISTGKVEVINVAGDLEYNVAILDSRAVLNENYYTFEVDVASYGRASSVTVNVEVYDANDTAGNTLKTSLNVQIGGEEVKTVKFDKDADLIVTAYGYAYVYITENDSFSYDNSFYIYGGTKEEIKILYASSIPNKFFRGSLYALRDALASRWSITIETVDASTESNIPTSGYDFYIYEKTTPKTMPKDGAVLFVAPTRMPAGSGVSVGSSVRSGNFTLNTVGEHTVTDGLNADGVLVTKISEITVNDEYEVLLTCFKETALAVKNEAKSKVAIIGFELQNSDLSLLLTFPKLFFNLFNYYFPYTVEDYNFEVGEKVTVNARGEELKVSGQGVNIELKELPTELTLSRYGTYSFTQELMTGKTVTENVYVKIPNSESDFTTEVEELANPHVDNSSVKADYDLLLWIAALLVLCLFVEWEINSRMQ